VAAILLLAAFGADIAGMIESVTDALP
jgi:hypothetical protein